MPRFVRIAEVWCLRGQFALQVSPIVGILWLIGWEIGEDVDEYLVGKMEYCETVRNLSIPSERERGYIGLSDLHAHAGFLQECPVAGS